MTINKIVARLRATAGSSLALGTEKYFKSLGLDGEADDKGRFYYKGEDGAARRTLTENLHKPSKVSRFGCVWAVSGKGYIVLHKSRGYL